MSKLEIIEFMKTIPMEDVLKQTFIKLSASLAVEGVKKIGTKFQKDSIEYQVYRLISETMSQFYHKMINELKKGVEYDDYKDYNIDNIVVDFCELYKRNKDSINKNSLRNFVEKSIFRDEYKLTDEEYQLWISIFVDNLLKYPQLYEKCKIWNNISNNTFTRRDLMIQKIIAKLYIFTYDENHKEKCFQTLFDESIFNNLNGLFNSSWKNELLTLIEKLPSDNSIRDKITVKKNFIVENNDCEEVLYAIEELFELYDSRKSPSYLVDEIKDGIRYPKFNKVFIVTGTTGSGKTFFIKEYITKIISSIEENDISILPFIIDIQKINDFNHFEDFIIKELNSLIGDKLETIAEINKFFEGLSFKVCFVIDDLNLRILQKEDWDKMIQVIEYFSRFEQFRWLLSIDVYEYYYFEYDNSFLNKYCINQATVTESDNIGAEIFNNAFSIDQYNKEQHTVELILQLKYGINAEIFSHDSSFGITTPKEAHYFGQVALEEEMIKIPSTYYDYINKIVEWKNDALLSQNPFGFENDLRNIVEFINKNHICVLEGLDLNTIDLLPFRKVQLVNLVSIKNTSTSMFDLDQGAIKRFYKINIFPFWAAKLTNIINIKDLKNVSDLSLFPKELSEWLIPCIIFFNFESCKESNDYNELFHFFNILNEQKILHYALFCANKASNYFSKELFKYLIKNMNSYITGAKECYSVLYFVFYSKLKISEKLKLLNTIADFIPRFGFEELYKKVFRSIINNSKNDKKLKKNLLEVSLCCVGKVNRINGLNAGAKYVKLIQEKELEEVVGDIKSYIESHPALLSTITDSGNNESFMDFFIRKYFENYLYELYGKNLFLKEDSLSSVYKRLDKFFELKKPMGSYIKRNLTCAAGNVFFYYYNEKYQEDYINLVQEFAKKNNLYQRLTALFLITNSTDPKKNKLDDRLKPILLNLSSDEEIRIKGGERIQELLEA